MSELADCGIWSIWKDDWLPFLPLVPAVLSDDERERAARFHFEKDRDLFVISHAAVRILLSRTLAVAPHTVRFGTQRSGKPVVVGFEGKVRFNLSHSSGCALIGVSTSGDIGVDVEKVSAGRGLRDLVASRFSSGERAELDGLEGRAWVNGFYRVWTLKEAYLKAEGVGLIDALSEIEFDLADPVCAPILRSPLDGFDVSRWFARSLDLGRGYAAAMVTEERCRDLEVRRFVPSETDFQI